MLVIWNYLQKHGRENPRYVVVVWISVHVLYPYLCIMCEMSVNLWELARVSEENLDRIREILLVKITELSLTKQLWVKVFQSVSAVVARKFNYEMLHVAVVASSKTNLNVTWYEAVVQKHSHMGDGAF